MSWFQNLFDARRKIGGWRGDYNEQRRHSSLGLSYTMRIRSVDGEHELYKRRRLRPLGIRRWRFPFPTSPATRMG